MKPQTGKYYRVNGLSQFRYIYKIFGRMSFIKDIFMSGECTRIEVSTELSTDWDAKEITKAQFDRFEALANARIKQHEYYSQI